MSKKFKTKAYIREPDGCVFLVECVKTWAIDDQMIAIQAEDGLVYITHVTNVLIVQEEVTECDEKE